MICFLCKIINTKGKLETTLLYLRKDDEILLVNKKREFAKDKYNGVGGKIEFGKFGYSVQKKKKYKTLFRQLKK